MINKDLYNKKEMGEISKQISIYLSLFLCCAPYTMIATFYPNIAVSKGIPYWVIGLVFCSEPFFGLIASILLGKYMIKISRKTTIILGLVFVSISTAALAPIEYCDMEIVLLLSFTSRIFTGIGSTSATVAADSICMSGYPESIEKMIGRVEIAIGFGISIGPLLEHLYIYEY